MALSFDIQKAVVVPGTNNTVMGVVDITLDGAYVKGGWSIAPSDLNIESISSLVPCGGVNGVVLEWDAANSKLKGYLGTVPGSTATGTITDDDSAASNGTDVVVVHQDENVALLYSTTAGNANTAFEIGEDGPVVTVYDSDSPGGVALYFDEDGTVGQRLMCVSPTNEDLWVQTTRGTWLHIYDNDDAASDGVAVHIDDDGAAEAAPR